MDDDPKVEDQLRGVPPQSAAAEPFTVKARDLGLRPGLSLDCISALLQQVEGPDHR